MKNKKFLGTIVTSMILLSGCGGSGFKGSVSGTSQNSQGTSSEVSYEEFIQTSNLPTFDSTTPVTINFWHTMGDTLQTQLNAIIARFNEKYPNITVNHEQIGSYNEVRDNVLTNIPVNTAPNLAYCYPDHVALYRDSRAVQSLNDYITDVAVGMTEAERNSFVKGFYDEGRSFGDGHMYSLPFVKSTEVLYYNETFFAQNNLKVPTTWEEVWSTCRKLKELDPTCVPLGYDSEPNWFITHAEQYGLTYTSTDTSHGAAGHFLFNTTGNRAFVDDLKAKFNEGLFTTEEVYGSYTSGLFTADTNKSYMCIGSTGGASYQTSTSFTTGIATIPQAEANVEGRKNAVISQGPSICMFKKDNPQETLASWLFLKFITLDVQSQVDFAKASGYIPCTTTAQEDDSYKAYLNTAEGNKAGITALAAKVAVAQSDYYFTSPTFVGSSQARDAVGTILYEVLTNAKTTEQAFDDAIQACIEAVS